ncbi:MAG: hypothetical protein RR879_07305 [Hydrogenoanaerobacterium sp.]
MTGARISWIAINYNLPINPSKNRVYVWRKLKEMGAVAFNHGVSVLPKSSKKVSELVLLCEKIKSMGGEAAIIEMSFINRNDEQQMAERFEAQGRQECDEILQDCDDILSRIKSSSVKLDRPTSDEIKQLMRRYGKARGRGHFNSVEEAELIKRIDRIFDRCVSDASEMAEQLKKIIDKAKF